MSRILHSAAILGCALSTLLLLQFLSPALAYSDGCWNCCDCCTCCCESDNGGDGKCCRDGWQQQSLQMYPRPGLSETEQDKQIKEAWDAEYPASKYPLPFPSDDTKELFEMLQALGFDVYAVLDGDGEIMILFTVPFSPDNPAAIEQCVPPPGACGGGTGEEPYWMGNLEPMVLPNAEGKCRYSNSEGNVGYAADENAIGTCRDDRLTRWCCDDDCD